MGAFLYVYPNGVSSTAPAEWPEDLLTSWRGVTDRSWLQADSSICCLLHDEQDWDAATTTAYTLLAQLGESGYGGAGLANSSFSARCAARIAKPGELRIITPGQEAAAMDGLPVSWLPDLAATAVRDLHALRVFTLGELAAVPAAVLGSVFGQQALGWQALAHGADHLSGSSPPRRLNHPTVHYALNSDSRVLTSADLAPLFAALAAALALAERAAAALLVTVGFADGRQSERAERQRRSLIAAEELQTAAWPAVVKLLRARRRRPEWIAVAATRTTEALVQLPLPLPLAADERERQLHATVNALQARFGPQIISFGLPQAGG